MTVNPPATQEDKNNALRLCFPATEMTCREYAAIKLKVPDSGDIDLDEMIRKSLRNDFAKVCLQGYMVGLKPAQDIGPDMQDKIAGGLFSMAHAMLKAGEAV